MDPRREPVLILALIASAIQMFSAFIFQLTVDQQGVLNAAAVAIAGVISAILVRSDQLAPLILGLAQAIIAVGLAFGWDLDPSGQSVIMAFITALVSVVVRHQVVAPVAAKPAVVEPSAA